MSPKECFLCWKVVNASSADNNEELYTFSENQIENCKKYLADNIIGECGSTNNSNLLWNIQVFCTTCFDTAESLTAVNEVLLDVQIQLKNIIAEFNQQILKERFKQPGKKVDYACEIKEEISQEYSAGGEDHFLYDEPENVSESESSKFQDSSCQLVTTTNEHQMDEVTSIVNDCPPRKRKKSSKENKVLKERMKLPRESNYTSAENEEQVLHSPTRKRKYMTSTYQQELNTPKVAAIVPNKLYLDIDTKVEIITMEDSPESINDILNNDHDINTENSILPDYPDSNDGLEFSSDPLAVYPDTSTISSRSMTTRAAKKAMELGKIIERKKYVEPLDSDTSDTVDDEQQAEVPTCEKCGLTFKRHRALLLHQTRYKDCEVKERHKKVFTCEVCGGTFLTKNQVRHMRTHTKEKPYSCEDCGKKFTKPTLLNCHRRVHITDFNFSCSRCDEKFKIKTDLTIHELKHRKKDWMLSGSKGMYYQCTICKERFKKSSDLDLYLAHMLSHSNYECIVCSQKFDTKKSLDEHHSEEHPDGYPCKMCSHKSTTVKEMKKHLLEFHVEKHMCEECGKSYKTTTSLKKHRLEKHPISTEKNFRCMEEDCDESFLTKNQLMSHRNYFHKIIQCEVCGVKVRGGLMRSHMECHNEVPFECDVCGRKFKRNDKMKQHKKVAHDGQKRECQVCGQKFTANHNLMMHMRKHTGENKPYECGFCNKSFNRNYDFKTHLLTHTGEIPYKCEICSKIFFLQNNFNAHVQMCSSVKGQEIE